MRSTMEVSGVVTFAYVIWPYVIFMLQSLLMSVSAVTFWSFSIVFLGPQHSKSLGPKPPQKIKFIPSGARKRVVSSLPWCLLQWSNGNAVIQYFFPGLTLSVYCHAFQCEAPKIAKLVYNSNNYGLWYL